MVLRNPNPPPYLTEVQGLLDSMLRVAIHTVKARRFSLMLFDEDFQKLRVVQYTGMDPEIAARTEVASGERVSGWVVEKRKPLLVQRPSEAPVTLSGGTGYETDSFASLPIVVEGRVYGVLNAADKEDGSPLSEHDFATLQLLASHIGLLIERSLLQAKIRAQASTDGLTGTYNHRYFHERLDEEIARAKRHGHPLSLLMLDLNNFKQFNDLYGHPVGDRILVEAAAILQDTVRATDILCRYGGDEFTVILPEVDAFGALSMARRIEKKIREQHFTARGALQPQRVTVSIGISSYPTLAPDRERLISQADEALYWTKDSPKERILIWQIGNQPPLFSSQ